MFQSSSRSRFLCGSVVVLSLALVCAAPVHAEPAYVSDQLSTQLYSTPSAAARVLDRALPSGAVIEILEPAGSDGFVHVRTAAGLEGWLPEYAVATEPPARVRLVDAEAELARLRASVAELRGDRQPIQAETGTTGFDATTGTATGDPTSAELAGALERLRAELAELRRSSGANGTEANQQRLTELNAQLRQEVETLALELQAVREGGSRRWFLYGAGLTLLGLFIGVLIKARPRRSAWS